MIDRKKRIKELQRKSRLKQVCNQMQVVFKELKEENFLESDEISQFQKKVISIMDYMDKNKQSEKISAKMDYRKWIIENIKTMEIQWEREIILFTAWNNETFAVTLFVEEIVNNIDYAISVSSIANNGCSFIIVDKRLETGLCLWKTEYEVIGYKW